MSHNRGKYNRRDQEYTREVFNVAVDSLETVFDQFVDFVVGKSPKKDKNEREFYNH